MFKNIENLQKNPLFADCEAEDVLKFVTCTKPLERKLARYELLHAQDEPLATIIVVLTGRLSLTRQGYAGQISLIDELQAGDVYGQMTAFGGSKRDPLCISAEEESHVLLFANHIFYGSCASACRSHQLVVRNMLSLLANQTARLSEKISYLTCATLKGKIARYLMQEAGKAKEGETFLIRHNRETLATVLGVARPSLSRALNQLKEEKIINFTRNQFVILDAQSLSELE